MSCFDDYLTKLESGEEILNFDRGELGWGTFSFLITGFMRIHCNELDGDHESIIHDKIMSHYGDRINKLYYDKFY